LLGDSRDQLARRREIFFSLVRALDLARAVLLSPPRTRFLNFAPGTELRTYEIRFQHFVSAGFQGTLDYSRESHISGFGVDFFFGFGILIGSLID
jgi:hypothetical protein